jgi:3'-phosphoadenosine 5'-phosphosulfate sulfotransferase (PAPS reductase)/FAD synthetase
MRHSITVGGIPWWVNKMGKNNLIVSSSRHRDGAQLLRLQRLPLNQKVNLTLRRIQQFYIEMGGKIYVAFSGGKDSRVLLHLVRSLYPDTPAVFNNTGVEFPEILKFVREFDNTVELTPKMSFPAVIKKYGYPAVSKDNSQKLHEIRTTGSVKLLSNRLYGNEKGHGKLPEKWKYLIDCGFPISHKCCDVLKKNPSKAYEKKTGLYPIIGTMASESSLRETNWYKYGCNAFNTKRPNSRPLTFWTEEDIWGYIALENLKVSEIYKTEKRTGCMYCLFGCQFRGEDGAERIDRLEESHPKHYRFAEKLGIIDVLDIIRPKEAL